MIFPSSLKTEMYFRGRFYIAQQSVFSKGKGELKVSLIPVKINNILVCVTCSCTIVHEIKSLNPYQYTQKLSWDDVEHELLLTEYALVRKELEELGEYNRSNQRDQRGKDQYE